MDEHVLLVPIRFGRLKPIFLLAGRNLCPPRARVLGVPVTLRELLVSVDDPDGLVTALA
jgi:hypothetical protein